MWKKFITVFNGWPWPLKILVIGLIILLPFWLILPIVLKIAQNQGWTTSLRSLWKKGPDQLTALKLRELSARFDIPYEWLIKVISIETGGTFDPTIVNKTTGAKGLFQFIPETVTWLGYQSVPDSGTKQVEMFMDYLRKNGFGPGRIKTEGDLYLTIFYPAAVGKSDEFVLGSYRLPASLVARQNPGLDLNKDQKITVGEIKQYVEAY